MMNSFTDADVPIENIVRFGSDGCNTMMGKNNSVSSRLRNDLPGITVQRCVCHSVRYVAYMPICTPICLFLPFRSQNLCNNVQSPSLSFMRFEITENKFEKKPHHFRSTLHQGLNITLEIGITSFIQLQKPLYVDKS